MHVRLPEPELQQLHVPNLPLHKKKKNITEKDRMNVALLCP